MLVCIGPICVPIWQVGVILVALAGPLRAFGRYVFALCSRRKRKAFIFDEPFSTHALHLYRGAQACPVYEEIKRRVTQREIQVLHIRNDDEMRNFWETVRGKEEVNVFADFSAQWCGPCRAISPFFELLCAGYEGVYISIDIDECPYTAEAAGVNVLPTLGLLKDTAAGAGYPWEIVASTTGANARKWEEFVAGYSVPRGLSNSGAGAGTY